MNKYWLYVVLAALFEVYWVAGLKHSEGITEWGLTIIAIVATFILLPVTAKHLPIGTVYAVFAGLGTAGTVIVEITVYGEPFHLLKVILIGTLLIGVIGLKQVSSEPSKSKGVT
ncbi:QacE family quaternary ammonium compound efflux SMR transporter [Aquibacillus halophilus]|uniref:QacE family quaternary ammonium compound efflux SMR transporter n=1 Tax=Aquibacillus halophilus TaxID=930132 RepID=A0A6A8DGZ5_9BACI|nr:multidrug efflux SMR transporter [Aquibacillus halophilus]MRH44510.1 QacE family quaternary ammonium compound efflux SMR transporter [Aquibacillus halophilus]